MRSMGMTMQIVYLWSTFTFLLQKHCNTKELLCTVKESNGSTIYTVPKYKATGCEVYLTDPNGNNLKYLNPENEMKEQSEWTFSFKDCHTQLNFSCTCLSEMEQNTANCTTDCSRKEKGEGDQQEMKNEPPNSANDNVTPRHHWTLMVPVIIFLVF